MNKLLKILDTKKSLLKNKSIKDNIKKMNLLFKNYKIDFPIKNELDYYNACLTYRGILNKEIYEKVYEDNRQDLLDLWNTIDRNKKNFFSNKALDEYRNNMPYFDFQGSICRMPMLEKLFNNLYEKEIAILELPQYFKFKNNFKDHLINPFELYFDLPYKSNFIDVDYIYSDENHLSIYEKTNNNLYIFNKDKSILKIGLKSNISQFKDVEFVKSIIDNDIKKTVEILNNNSFIDIKVLNKINKYFVKKIKSK